MYPVAVYASSNIGQHNQLSCIRLKHYVLFSQWLRTQDLCHCFFCFVFFVSVPKSGVKYWHTQLPCTQGSKLNVPMVVHPRSISLLEYPVYTGSISLLPYLTVVYTGSDIGLVYPVVVHTDLYRCYCQQLQIFTAYPISHYPR